MMDEWAGVTNTEERRRIQNRLSQRKRRERLRTEDTSRARGRSVDSRGSTPQPRYRNSTPQSRYRDTTPQPRYRATTPQRSPYLYPLILDSDNSPPMADHSMMNRNCAYGDMPLLTQALSHADMTMTWSDCDTPPQLDMGLPSVSSSVDSFAPHIRNQMMSDPPQQTSLFPERPQFPAMRRISDSSEVFGHRARAWSCDQIPTISTWQQCKSPPLETLSECNDSVSHAAKLEVKIDVAITALKKLYESGVYLDMIKEDASLAADLESIRRRIHMNSTQ